MPADASHPGRVLDAARSCLLFGGRRGTAAQSVRMSRDKVRIRFRKGGDLRFLSHHDLLRAFERMMRRAELPLRFSEGFHPKPRMVFASALALGVVGVEEVLEIELTDALPADELHRRLAKESPAGLEILYVKRVDPGLTARVSRAVYELPLPPECLPGLGARVAEILQQKECWVDRAKPQPRRVNVRAFLIDLAVRDDRLIIELFVTPQGSARPEEVLRLLGLDHLPLEGVVLERTRLEIEDELGTPNDAAPGREQLTAPAAVLATLSKGST